MIPSETDNIDYVLFFFSSAPVGIGVVSGESDLSQDGRYCL